MLSASTWDTVIWEMATSASNSPTARATVATVAVVAVGSRRLELAFAASLPPLAISRGAFVVPDVLAFHSARISLVVALLPRSAARGNGMNCQEAGHRVDQATSERRCTPGDG